MAYTVIDLLDKSINIAEKRKKLYITAVLSAPKNSSLYILLNVLIKSQDKTIEYLNELKLQSNNVISEEIAFDVYDKISFLTNEFNQKLFMPDNLDIKSLIESSLDMEKNILALYIDIQGRLVKKDTDTKTDTYKILSKIILQKEKKIKDIESFFKNYSL